MRILCYGDSNTWGWVPNINGYSKDAIISQYAKEDCWWYTLSKTNEVFVNGLPGRCISHNNRWVKNSNATETIADDLKDYTNLDLIIVLLGTNDCKSEYGSTAEEITKSLQMLLRKIKEITHSQIVVISPAIIRENTKITRKYYIGAENKSKKLESLYYELSKQEGYLFVSGKDLEIGEDGEHLTKVGHKKLSERVTSQVFSLSKFNNLSL